jgi:hypothetical protein
MKTPDKTPSSMKQHGFSKVLRFELDGSHVAFKIVRQLPCDRCGSRPVSASSGKLA